MNELTREPKKCKKLLGFITAIALLVTMIAVSPVTTVKAAEAHAIAIDTIATQHTSTRCFIPSTVSVFWKAVEGADHYIVRLSDNYFHTSYRQVTSKIPFAIIREDLTGDIVDFNKKLQVLIIAVMPDGTLYMGPSHTPVTKVTSMYF